MDRLAGESCDMKLRWPLRRAGVEAFSRSAEVSAVRHGDRLVLMDLGGERFYSLDQVAGRLWELLNEPATVERLADRLADEFDAPIETIRADVAECLSGMARDGLVKAGR